MRAIAVRLEGPLQSWGTWSIGDDRSTHDFPSRSGVLGLVACCLGITRAMRDELVRLHELCSVHVRVDRPGTLLVDDQTIQGLNEVRLRNGDTRASNTRATIQSKRSYLADASFAVLVETDEITCARIAEALRYPRFLPFLGRKSCLPATRLYSGEVACATDREDAILALFSGVPSCERSRGDGITEFYIDGEFDHPAKVRTLSQRDRLKAQLPRQFDHRSITHLRFTQNGSQRANTIDGWMPS